MPVKDTLIPCEPREGRKQQSKGDATCAPFSQRRGHLIYFNFPLIAQTEALLASLPSCETPKHRHEATGVRHEEARNAVEEFGWLRFPCVVVRWSWELERECAWKEAGEESVL